jgi:hypothetical protein
MLPPSCHIGRVTRRKENEEGGLLDLPNLFHKIGIYLKLDFPNLVQALGLYYLHFIHTHISLANYDDGHQDESP